jgi:rhodanese-related sulfurtransferase
MLIIAAIVCIAVLIAATLVKRARDRQVLEQHCITPEDLHVLLGSPSNVALFDVRLPLDLLANSVVIPGAQRLNPEDVVANPGVIPKDRDSVVYCTCPSDGTSHRILRKALAMGILRVRFLKGGLDAWQEKGYPVEPYDKSFRLRPESATLLRQEPVPIARVNGTASGYQPEVRSK